MRSYENEVFLSWALLYKLRKGTYLQSEYGNAYVVVTVWPSIGGTTEVRFTLRHLQSDEEFTWNFNEMRYHRLKYLEPKDVPLLLLGAT